MKTNLCLAMVALVFFFGVSLIHAEDWTVNGKTYPNVKVTKVDPDKVHIMFEGGIGSVKLSDLPPDLQKRFNYDPTAAKTAAQAEQAREAASDAQVAAAAKRAQAANATADAVASMQSLKLFGTISAGKAGSYTVSALGNNDLLPSGMMTVFEYLANKSTSAKDMPKLAMPTGGTCTLISSQNYTVDQFIQITVYPAGTNSTGSSSYSQFSDDVATAAKLAQGK